MSEAQRLVLTEDQTLLRESAEGFFAEHAPVSAFRALRDSKNPKAYDEKLWASMGEMGFAGVLVPEEQGGSGFGFTGAGLICEAMGRNLTASPFLSTAMMAAVALSASGNEALAAKHLPAIAAASSIIAVAVDEGRKHDPSAIRLRYEASGNGFTLNGEKTFVADGAAADQILVAASNEAGGIALFLVPREAAGLSTERTVMVDQRNFARLSFKDVKVTGAEALGEIGQAAGLLERVLDAGRAGLAAELSGMAQESFARTVSYLRDRKQFGRSIGSFQALQHRAAHLHVQIEMVRSCVLNALQALDRDPLTAGPAVALAKAKASDVARLAASEGVQMHGGIGMTDQFDIGLFMKRTRVAAEMLGDTAFHAGRLMQLRGG